MARPRSPAQLEKTSRRIRDRLTEEARRRRDSSRSAYEAAVGADPAVAAPPPSSAVAAAHARRLPRASRAVRAPRARPAPATAAAEAPTGDSSPPGPPPPGPPPLAYFGDDLARAVGVKTPAAAYRALRKAGVPCFHFGRRIGVRVAALDAHFAALEAVAPRGRAVRARRLPAPPAPDWARAALAGGRRRS